MRRQPPTDNGIGRDARAREAGLDNRIYMRAPDGCFIVVGEATGLLGGGWPADEAAGTRSPDDG